MVKKTNPDTQHCGCEFLLDQDGRPVVECPDQSTQDLAYQALRKYPDVQIRVAASITPSVIEDSDIADSDTDGFEDDELEPEFDFDDDSEDLDDLENQ